MATFIIGRQRTNVAIIHVTRVTIVQVMKTVVNVNDGIRHIHPPNRRLRLFLYSLGKDELPLPYLCYSNEIYCFLVCVF